MRILRELIANLQALSLLERVLLLILPLLVIGIAAIAMESNRSDGWDSIEYFRPDDFRCKGDGCCFRDGTADINLVKRLDTLRSLVGFPLRVSSGCRCKEHNNEVRGAAESEHLPRDGVCYAADIECKTARERYLIVKHALHLFSRVGIGNTFIHLGVDKTKDQDVIWLYSSKRRARDK